LALEITATMGMTKFFRRYSNEIKQSNHEQQSGHEEHLSNELKLTAIFKKDEQPRSFKARGVDISVNYNDNKLIPRREPFTSDLEAFDMYVHELKTTVSRAPTDSPCCEEFWTKMHSTLELRQWDSISSMSQISTL
jgi:hypothetical protein